MSVVVLGGAGTLGRAVVSGLRTRGATTRSASRRTGVDLASGRGLVEGLAGAEVVVHAASNPLHARRVDLVGTRRLVDAVRRSTAPVHLVYVSIVGCDANPYPYYRAKHACEEVLEASGLAVTVVRATQFHPFVADLARTARPLAFGVTVRGLAVQPCDVGWVADQVSAVAAAPPPPGFRRHPDLAGPGRLAFSEVLTTTAGHDGVRLRRTVTLPALGGAARAFAAGAHLPGPTAELGGPTFADWLAGQQAAPGDA